jgi:PTH1 family peptidyl-tRNA hydrolase
MDLVAVIGLGNPGAEYEATRHNVGFAVVDELARRWRVTVWRRRHRSLVARRTGGRDVLLVKPQTFMNDSGEAVGALCEGEAFVPDACLVVVDDVDLSLGQLRLRRRGGSGTHNGLRSVVAAVGEVFPRLRLGVRGEQATGDLADYVLAPFDVAEREAAAAMIGQAADCIEMALRVGVARAADRYNRSA